MREEDELAREAATFARYLCGVAAGEYVVERYRAAHALGLVELRATSSFERAVVALARRGTWSARAMDASTRLVQPAGLLRRKLVLLLALLESRSPPAEAIDAPTAGSRSGLLLHAAGLTLLYGVHALAGLLILAPVRLACALRRDGAEGAAR
jgi:hypothetical protein